MLQSGTTAVTTDDRIYVVGQDRAGRWLAMDTEGRSGGMFATREDAMRFARSQTDRRPGAVHEPARRMVFL